MNVMRFMVSACSTWDYSTLPPLPRGRQAHSGRTKRRTSGRNNRDTGREAKGCKVDRETIGKPTHGQDSPVIGLRPQREVTQRDALKLCVAQNGINVESAHISWTCGTTRLHWGSCPQSPEPCARQKAIAPAELPTPINSAPSNISPWSLSRVSARRNTPSSLV